MKEVLSVKISNIILNFLAKAINMYYLIIYPTQKGSTCPSSGLMIQIFPSW